MLHEPRTDAPETGVSAVSIEFENDLRRIYSRSRTLDEVTREISSLSGGERARMSLAIMTLARANLLILE